MPENAGATSFFRILIKEVALDIKLQFRIGLPQKLRGSGEGSGRFSMIVFQGGEQIR